MINKDRLIEDRNIAFSMFFDIVEVTLYYGVCRGWAGGEADFSERVNESLGVLARDLLSDIQKKDKHSKER